MKTREVARALVGVRENFDREVERVAELARAQLVPYFQKRGWSYRAGNGTWYVKDRRGRTIEDHKLPTAVRDVLHLEVEHTGHRPQLAIRAVYSHPEHTQLLGFFIRDIDCENTP